MIGRIFFPCILALTLGCHTYMPVSATQVTPTQVVRITLNDTGRKALEPQVGPNIDFLQGTVAARDSNSVTIDAGIIKRLTTPEEKYGSPRHVAIPLTGLSSIGISKVSKSRTALLAGASVVGALLIGNSVSGGDLFGDKGGPSKPIGQQ